MKILISAFEPSAKLYLSRIIPYFDQEYIYSVIRINKKTIPIYRNDHSNFLGTIGIPQLRFFNVFLETLNFLSNAKVDLAILVDSPDFNILLGTVIKSTNRKIKVVFYIPPTVWAWRPHRKELVEKIADKILFVFPFERNIWTKRGVFTGHPLCRIIEDEMRDWRRQKIEDGIKLAGSKRYAILPGSRISEIRSHESLVNELAKELSPSVILIPTDFPIQIQNSNVKIFPTHLSRWVMHISDAVICASGTASLEAALLKKPAVVFYKLPKFPFEIAKRLVNVKFVSLPNIILNDEIYPEFIQESATSTNIIDGLKKVEHNEKKFTRVGDELYSLLRGFDFKTIAQIMIEE